MSSTSPEETLDQNSPSSQPHDAPTQVGGPYAYYVLAVLFVVYVFNFIDRQILSILLQPIKEDLQVSDTAMGFLTGFAFAVFYANCRPAARPCSRPLGPAEPNCPESRDLEPDDRGLRIGAEFYRSGISPGGRRRGRGGMHPTGALPAVRLFPSRKARDRARRICVRHLYGCGPGLLVGRLAERRFWLAGGVYGHWSSRCRHGCRGSFHGSGGLHAA